MSRLRLVHQRHTYTIRNDDRGSVDRQMAVVEQLTSTDSEFTFEGVGTFPPFVHVGDGQRDLVSLWCPPCRTQVGLIWCVEVAPRLASHGPYLIADTQHPTGRSNTKGRPLFKRMSAVIDDASDQGAMLLVLGNGGAPPPELGTYCAHGRLTFEVGEARTRGHKALAAIVATEARGDTPRMSRWKLRQR